MLMTVLKSFGRLFTFRCCFWVGVLVVFAFAAGCNKRSRQGYSDSLLVVTTAQNPSFRAYPDGRQQVIYAVETEYPADDILIVLKTELQRLGWKPLPEMFFSPGTPSSLQRGWNFIEDDTQQPRVGVYGWGADWENSSHDVTEYSLQYKSPGNSTRDLKTVEVTAIFIPARIAAKGKQVSQPRKLGLLN
jgi:hypothetical protein